MQHAAGHLFGPQAGQREPGPCFFGQLGVVAAGGTVEPEDLRAGDEANESAQVEAMSGKILGEDVQGRPMRDQDGRREQGGMAGRGGEQP